MTRADRKRRTLARPNHVYIARRVSGGPVKIGISCCPAARVYQLERRLGEPLALLWQAPHPEARAVEMMAHASLAENRDQGEWFGITPEAAIEAVKAAIARREGGTPRAPGVTDCRPILADIRRRAALLDRLAAIADLTAEASGMPVPAQTAELIAQGRGLLAREERAAMGLPPRADRAD